MRYLALATDYDGTLADKGRVPRTTVQALESLRKSGRYLILVTGRALPDLQRIFDRLDLFSVVVAENGAMLFHPTTLVKTLLADAPAPEFLECLRKKQVQFAVGESIVAASSQQAPKVLEAIQETGLDLQVILNKDSAMVLPSGVNKATGLLAALDQLGISAHNTIAVGDGENDHALLASCGFGVAVANAVPMLKERADWVTLGECSKGVEDLISMIVAEDLSSFNRHLERRRCRE